MPQLSVGIVAEHIIPPSLVLETALAAIAGTINEGQYVGANFSVNWNGATPVAFYARFAGPTVPVVDPTATFVQNVVEAIIASVAAYKAAHPSEDVTLDPADDRRVNFGANFTGPLPLNRLTRNRPEAQGNELSGWKCTFVSRGTFLGNETVTTITDFGAVAPPITQLATITTSPLPGLVYVARNAPADTYVCDILGKDSANAAVAITATLLDTHGGRFKIVAVGGVPKVYTTGSPAVDFEGVTAPAPLIQYNITARGQDGHTPTPNTADLGIIIGAIFEKIVLSTVPQTQQNPADPAAFITAAKVVGLANKKIVLGPGYISATGGVYTQSSATLQHVLNPVGNNTIEMRRNSAGKYSVLHLHRGVITRKGDDMLYRGLDMHPGNQNYLNGETQQALLEIDAWDVGQGATDWLRRHKFEYCGFANATDEQISFNIIARLFSHRGIWMERCIVAEGLIEAGHDKGNHNRGSLATGETGPMNVVWTRNLGLGMRDQPTARAFRYPKVTACSGMVIFNNEFGWWDGTIGGTQLFPALDPIKGPFYALTSRVEGNLYHPGDTVAGATYNNRDKAIAIGWAPDPSIVKNYVPLTGNYRNFYINRTTDNFGDDPLVLGTGVFVFPDAHANALVSVKPFELADDYGLLPTDTEAHRRVIGDNIDWVGPRLDANGDPQPGDAELPHYWYDVVHGYRTTGVPRTLTGGANPARPIPKLDELYGDASKPSGQWNGGGTLGWGMADRV